jgi:YceI-like domain
VGRDVNLSVDGRYRRSSGHQDQADSVNTGSGMKDDKIKGKDFFNVKEDPQITFHSTKIVQTGPNTLMCRDSLPFAASPNPKR